VNPLGKVFKACPECGKDLVLRDGSFGYFYGCMGFPDCRNTWGANKFGDPLPEVEQLTNKARIRAHAAFDQLWKSAPKPGKARRAAYAWMAGAMGYLQKDTHIKLFTLQECEKLVTLVELELQKPTTEQLVTDLSEEDDLVERLTTEEVIVEEVQQAMKTAAKEEGKTVAAVQEELCGALNKTLKDQEV